MTRKSAAIQAAFEAKLGQSTHAYLKALRAAPAMQVTDRFQRLATEQGRLRDICSTIEYFMCHLMRGRKGWTRHRWFDGIYADQLLVQLPNDVEFLGMALWGKGQSSFWLDPFHARLKLADGTNQIRSYSFAFGDADVGLGTTPYKQPRFITKPIPSKWMFVIDGHPTPPARVTR